MKNKTIELPFNIGDTVYIINSNEEIVKSTVTNVLFDLKNNFFTVETDKITFCSDDFGYSAFKNYEEASSRLKELKERQEEVKEILMKGQRVWLWKWIIFYVNYLGINL